MELAAMEADNSVMDSNETPLRQPVDTGTISHDGTLTLRGLKLNDSGVFVCQLRTGKSTGLRYIKLTVNSKFLI